MAGKGKAGPAGGGRMECRRGCKPGPKGRAAGRPSDGRERAESRILELLEGGPMPSRDLMLAVTGEAGCSERAYERACHALGAERKQSGRKWFSLLPEGEPPTSGPSASGPSAGGAGSAGGMGAVYLAGRVTGDPGYRKKFARAARKLEKAGFAVLNPAALPPPGGLEYEACMRIGAAMLAECWAIALLPGWERSPGAARELAQARREGKAVWLL
jgi:hypothetical protein